MKKFGDHIRTKRTLLQEKDKSYSQRQVSLAIGIEPSYLSKIERGLPVTLSEEKIIALARTLHEDPDYLLALCGKISQDLQHIIIKRPLLFSKLIRALKDMPDEAIADDKAFRRIFGNLQKLHDMAPVGAFFFAQQEEDSYWTNQVPAILHLPAKTPPSLQTLCSALSSDSEKKLQAQLAQKNDKFDCDLVLAPRKGKRPQIIHVWMCGEACEEKADTVRMGIMQDVTENRLMREDIESAKKSLELTVEEQHGELTTAIGKLKDEVEFRKKLEESLRETTATIKKEKMIQQAFFTDTAHELRALATAMTSQPQKNPKTINSLLHGISSKINNMNDFLLLGNGLEKENSLLDLQAVISGVAGSFEATVEKSGLSFTKQFAPDFPKLVRSDKKRIIQICSAMLELLHKNTDWGSIHLCGEQHTEKANWIILNFSSDSFSRDVDQSLFYPGLKTDDMYETNPVRLVGPLTELLGGELEILPSGGRRMNFSLSLPMEIDAEKTISAVSENKVGPILVVEDDDYSRLFITRALQKKGYDVHEADSGNVALKKLSETKYSILLLDIQLPDISGLDIFNEMRKAPSSLNRQTPTIAVTAHVTPDHRQRFLEAGISSIIAKPFEIDELLSEMKLC
ncbi:response regulator [Pseudodesulfovibrio senegalensis]|uniref:response regulator n=1 Tax=Pseudodesulfovibrio senegalensis TaxID=1721087 RepID=UPI001375E8C3|nr:response regulator [Pseudodesulfovibrio senegalensis]